MGTFRARFTLQNTTGDAFQTSGVGDDASHFYNNTNPAGVEGIAKTGTITYALIGDCFFLDGSLIGIPFSGLPSGFTLDGLLALTTPNGNAGPTVMAQLIAAQTVPASATSIAALTWGSYGPNSATANAAVPALFLQDINDISLPAPIDLITFLQIVASITPVKVSAIDFSLNFNSIPDVIEVSGSYSIAMLSWTIDNTSPVNPGDTISVSSDGVNPDLLDVTQVTITYTDSDGNPVEIIIPTTDFLVWTSVLFSFVLPEELNDVVETLITFSGNIFSGSEEIGTLFILLEDGSGIYRIVANKTNDTLYVNAPVDDTTVDVKIPNPFIKTGFIGG
jgi:hypothetical protein